MRRIAESSRLLSYPKRQFLTWIGNRSSCANNFSELKWDDESYRKELRDEILQWEPTKPIEPHKVRVLVFGVTGQGKSSTLNSWVGCLTNKIHQPAHSASTGRPVTLKVGTVDPLENTGECYFEFLDMPGFTNIRKKDLEDVVLGHIKIGTELTLVGNRDSKGRSGCVRVRTPEKIIEDPHPLTRPCVVVLIAQAGKPLDERSRKKTGIVQKAAGRAQVRTQLVLTHTDELDGMESVTQISYSKKVQEAMSLAHNDMGLPMNSIFPVTNFVHQHTVDLNMSICLLFALREILRNARAEAQKRLGML